MTELWRLTACEVAELLRRREISPLELIDAAETRIEAVEPAINAIPIRCFDRAREHARRIMAERESHDGNAVSLHGLPIVVKDLTPVQGVRWTDGSRIYADRIASHSDIVIERLEASGAIVIGKSNTPEFGAGGNTVNDVFGATRNPWDARMTSGGSSGGSAAAVATGETWLATGTDMAGSIRYPSAYCSVVGLRPSPGRVAHGPRNLCFNAFNVDGPIARNVTDAALMLDAMIGENPIDPMALAPPLRSYADVVSEAKSRGARSLRVAWSPDLGVAPLDPEIKQVCTQAVQSFARAGALVSEACPDLRDANAAFYVLRNMQRVAGAAHLLREHRDLLSPEIVHYAERGLSHSAAEIGAAENTRGAIFHRMLAFFANYDILATPTVIAPPYDIRQRHLMEVAGTKFDDFFAYLMLTSIITITTCPAVSVPCGFTASGLPVGLQLIAKPRDDAGALAAAATFEALHDHASKLPIEPRSDARHFS